MYIGLFSAADEEIPGCHNPAQQQYWHFKMVSVLKTPNPACTLDPYCAHIVLLGHGGT
jgi:hypothetical protein